jgi:hypothetical protein
MAVPSAYLTSTKNTKKIFASIQKAAVPTQGFTYEFLKALGYASSSDRPIIPVLKAIKFLDESGKPTVLYRDYKDPAVARHALAKGIREGYADLFAIDTEAHTRTQAELAGMFGRLSDKGDSVTNKMGMTFHALASLADFSGAEEPLPVDEPEEQAPEADQANGQQQPPVDGGVHNGGGTITLRHDIHVHLPLSTEVAVYDAIFKSLRENLM